MMQKGYWTRIKLICANHGGDGAPEMAPHAPAEGNMSRSLYGSQANMFYACPRYYPENREEGEPCCRNHISIKEYEGIIGHLDRITSRYEADGGSIDLVGEKWRSKQGVEYKVVRQTREHIYVSCLNRKALWK